MKCPNCGAPVSQYAAGCDLWLLVAIEAPLIGGVLAGVFAYQANSDGNVVRRNLCLVAGAVAIIEIVLIRLAPGTYVRVFSPVP